MVDVRRLKVNVNFIVNFKIPFKTIHLCISWCIQNFDNTVVLFDGKNKQFVPLVKILNLPVLNTDRRTTVGREYNEGANVNISHWRCLYHIISENTIRKPLLTFRHRASSM